MMNFAFERMNFTFFIRMMNFAFNLMHFAGDEEELNAYDTAFYQGGRRQLAERLREGLQRKLQESGADNGTTQQQVQMVYS